MFCVSNLRITSNPTYKRYVQAFSRDNFGTEKQRVLHNLSTCKCSISYPARKAPAPYYIVVSDSLSLAYFSTLYNKVHDFLKKRYWQKNLCFGFLYNYYLRHFLF
jgi:hypothetical protein